MRFLEELQEQARENPRRIVFAEGYDSRIQAAAERIEAVGTAVPILRDSIDDAVNELLQDKADGLIAGAYLTTEEVMKQLLNAPQGRKQLRTGERVTSASIMVYPNFVRVFADIALDHSDPGQDQFTYSDEVYDRIIEGATYVARQIGLAPVVAELRHRTEGRYVQFDAATNREIAARKRSVVPGNANVLIYRNIDSGNNAYKVAQELGVKHLGPLLYGLSHPCSDLSRGADVEEICNTVYALSAMMRK